MEFNRCYGIQELLQPGMYTQRIKVKVSRRWYGESTERQAVRPIKLFLTDTSNFRIHCLIPCNLADFYMEYLEEDKCYEIKNFMISSYRSSFRWADDEFFMIFMHTTIVLPLQTNQYITTTETFNFTDLSQLNVEHFQEDHCIDVIGILASRSTVDFFINKHNEEEVYLDFQITDIINKVTVRFRNALAEKCNRALSTWSVDNCEPTTVSISSCKMQFNRYKNKVLLIDVPSTKFFINYQSEEHCILRQRFRQTRNSRS